MKTLRLLIILLIQLLILSSCTEEVDTLSIDDPYLGCWTEVTGKPGVYDITIEVDKFALGYGCQATIVAEGTSFLRNDTLILDVGAFEYWCYLKGDTLLYSEGTGNTIERLTKI